MTNVAELVAEMREDASSTISPPEGNMQVNVVIWHALDREPYTINSSNLDKAINTTKTNAHLLHSTGIFFSAF